MGRQNEIYLRFLHKLISKGDTGRKLIHTFQQNAWYVQIHKAFY